MDRGKFEALRLRPVPGSIVMQCSEVGMEVVGTLPGTPGDGRFPLN